MYFDYNEKIIGLCKRIRHDAILDRFSYKIKDKACDKIKHMVDLLNFCGVSVEEFIKNHLTNVQPAMVINEVWSMNSTGLYISTPFAITLLIWVPKKKDEDILVWIEKGHENGWIYESAHREGTQYVLTDRIEDRVKDENLCSIRIFVPVGVMCIPVSVTAQLDTSGTFICENKDILNGIKKWVDDYIYDLYASNIEFKSLNETEIFYVDKQIDAGKSLAGYVNRFSVLIDNMYVNEHPLHRKSAAFALIIFTVLTQLSFSEKEWHILSLQEKYKDKGKDIVIDFLTDVISQSDDYYEYCDYKYGNYTVETDEMKFIWGVKAYDDFSNCDANLFSMNDLELIYFKERDEYGFDWEDIYIFEKRKHAIRYYKRLLKLAYEWMISNGYDIDIKPEKIKKKPCRTVEDAYWYFYKKMRKKIKAWSK